MIGQTIAHYEVTEKVGAGGMGEVYRARDTKLGRDVALKVLPETFAVDEERLARFDREAKLLAGLNHANIAGIYGTEQHEGRHILVLEFVEGEDLQQRLDRGAIPGDDALAIAFQIADALEAAHDQGVVHRDLKPANLKVTPDGVVKVLDFGLAKALDNDDEDDISNSPTLLASSPTLQGVILGTAAYMSPEQARGKRVDRRADIFAFGCVFYEMLTGKRCFTGETISDTLASVLKEQPDMDELPGDTPYAIEKLISRCLDKNPRQRLRDIGEARILIDNVIRGDVDDSPVAAVATEPPSRRRTLLPYGLLAFVVLVAIALTQRITSTSIPEAPTRTFQLAVETERAAPRYPIISPDGTRVAFILADKLMVRSLDDLTPITIPTDQSPWEPFWSPDGTQIGYFADDRVWRVPAGGGASALVCDPTVGLTGGTGGTWTRDGRIIFGTGGSGLLEVSEAGGEESVFAPLLEHEGDLHEPWVMPNDRDVLFLSHDSGGMPDKLFVFANGDRKLLHEVKGARLSNPRYSDSGHILYRRAGSNAGLWALPFSAKTLEVTGEPFLVVSRGSEGSVSNDGTLTYLATGATEEFVTRWLHRDGTLSDPIGDPGFGRANPSFSPDGKRVVVSERGEESFDLWIHDLERESRTRITFSKNRALFPTWSPDGNYIYYSMAVTDSVYRKPADGTGSAEAVAKGGSPTISPDLKYMAYSLDNSGRGDVVYMDLESGEINTLVSTPADDDAPVFSPAGGYISFDSDVSGDWELYITSFPSGTGRWQVTQGDYAFGIWGADGNAMHFTSLRGNLL